MIKEEQIKSNININSFQNISDSYPLSNQGNQSSIAPSFSQSNNDNSIINSQKGDKNISLGDSNDSKIEFFDRERNNFQLIGNIINDEENKNSQNTIDNILKVNDYFLCYGKNSNLIKYKKNQKIIEEKIKDFNNIFLVESTNNNQEIFICFQKSINKYYLNKNGLGKNDNYDCEEKNNIIFAMNLEKNSFLLCSEEEASIKKDIFSKEKVMTEPNIVNALIKGGKKIGQSLVALKSNKIISKGKDKLYFYNFTSKKISEIKNYYSFTYSENGLEIFPSCESNVKNKTLLCACKKYIRNQKNGILIVNFENNINNDDNLFPKIEEYFFDTNNFEVFCFCPIIIKEDNIYFDEKIKKETNYFFVGGYNPKKYSGIIKLFKINYEVNDIKKKIEYIDDVFIDKKNREYTGPVSCITQSTNNDYLISFWNGEIKLMEKIKIDLYLKY